MAKIGKIEYLRNAIFREIEIGNFQKGSMIPSDRKLSEDFGASYMTIRRAVTLLVDEGVLKRVAKVGTLVVNDIPDDKLRPQLGMVLPAYASEEVSELMMYMAETAEKNGWRFKVIYSRNWDDRAIGDLWDSSDAVVCYPVRDVADLPPRLLERFRDRKKPSVLLRIPGEFFKTDSVFSPGNGEIIELCHKIYDLGHRQIVEVIQEVTVTGEKRPMAPITLKLAGALRTDFPDVEIDEFSLRLDIPYFEYPSDVLAKRIIDLKDKFKWSLLIVPLGMYWGAIYGLKKIGLQVPRDVSIVCIGDQRDAKLYCPEPTTLSFRNRRLIELTMELVLWRRDHQDAPLRHSEFSMEIVEGETLAIAK